MQARCFTGATRPSVGAGRPFCSRRPAVVVRAAVAAKPVPVPVKSADGASAGSVDLALGVAPAETAKGLVHRYLVYVQANARKVGVGVAAGAAALARARPACRRRHTPQRRQRRPWGPIRCKPGLRSQLGCSTNS
jgi:hypothetical protein